MHGYIPRQIESEIEDSLRDFPAVAILGPRQCGKSTLARKVVEKYEHAVYLDLERVSDRAKLEDAELFFQMQADESEVLTCLDEIQRTPELFKTLRSIIDRRGRNGQFLILGSASRDLIRQSSESLAGRIVFFELTPFFLSEVVATHGEKLDTLNHLWLRGGFPRSFLSSGDKSSTQWRENFVRTFLERDIPQLGFSIPAEMLRRLWSMLAHSQGQTLNSSKLGASLGVSHTTIRSYVDLLTQTFMVRVLPPTETNLKKRLVKSPKTYIRDSGVLHSLLQIGDSISLLGHPVHGGSWEGFVIENVCSSLTGWTPSFYRASSGAEIDLVMSRGIRRIAVECKASTAPSPARGFYNAIGDLGIDQAWIIAPVEDPYPVRDNVTVSPLPYFLNRCRNL
jgi:predicted AAA+ superfamily ATPase